VGQADHGEEKNDQFLEMKKVSTDC